MSQTMVASATASAREPAKDLAEIQRHAQLARGYDTPLSEARTKVTLPLHEIPRAPISATSEEWRAMEALLAKPPGIEGSGLTSQAQYLELVEETRQIVAARLASPRTENHMMSPIINMVVRGAIERYFDSHPRAIRELQPMTEARRSGTDRDFTLGQVGPQFVGRWPVSIRASEEASPKIAPFVVIISVAAELAGVPQPLSNQAHEARERALMDARGYEPWKIQVAHDSPLAGWFEELFGTDRVGQIRPPELKVGAPKPESLPRRGHESLGAFGGAVAAAAAAANLRGPLLPRGMGDPPKKPWQGGEFIKREGDQLVWASVVEDVHGALVQAKFRITLQAEVFEKTSLVVTRN